MKLHSSFLASAAALGGLASLLAAAGSQQKESPALAWQSDYAAAQATARQTGKPLFVVFR
jgi:hypothetical protein